MTSPTPQRPDGIPPGRIIAWAVIAALAAAGVYLFFRYVRDVPPVMG